MAKDEEKQLDSEKPETEPMQSDPEDEVRVAASKALRASAAFERDAEFRAKMEAGEYRITDAELQEMIDAAKRKLPRVFDTLKKNGDPSINGHMLRLAALPFEEEAILRLIGEGPVPENAALVSQPTYSPTRRQIEIIRHSIVRWWNREGKLARLVYLLGWSFALIGPSIQKGLTWSGAIGVAIVVLMRLRAQYKDLDHQDREIVDRNQRRRQLQLERFIEKTQRWTQRTPTADEVRDFQREVLDLINSFVRDHRSDIDGRQIFTNLLIRQGSAVTVIARSDLHRRVPEIYTPEECSHAWITLTTGAPQYTGDVYASAPGTRKGKRYSSVLVLPIKRDSCVLGAVSIDSSGKYHFDNVFTELQSDLAPYVQLLAITLAEDHDTSNPRELTDGERHGGNPDDPRPGS